jgi:CBS domain-containing protein
MTTNNKLWKFCASPDSTLAEIINMINDNHARCIFIVKENRLLGCISSGDIIRAMMSDASLLSTVDQWASTNVKTLTSFETDKALELVRKYGVTAIPLIDGAGNMIDVVTLDDILGRIS